MASQKMVYGLMSIQVKPMSMPGRWKISNVMTLNSTIKKISEYLKDKTYNVLEIRKSSNLRGVKTTIV